MTANYDGLFCNLENANDLALTAESNRVIGNAQKVTDAIQNAVNRGNLYTVLLSRVLNNCGDEELRAIAAQLEAKGFAVSIYEDYNPADGFDDTYIEISWAAHD